MCKGGTQKCTSQGLGFSPCVGEVTPATENCVTNADEDCDGETLDAEEGCACVPMTAASCYSGSEGTAGVGSCLAGVHICNELGTGYGACIGEVVPQAEVCISPQDDDCNGEAGCFGEHTWSKLFNGYLSPLIAADQSGGLVLAGPMSGSIDLGGGILTSAGDKDCLVAKFDASGNHVWSKRFGDTNLQNVSDVGTDSEGNIVITGQLRGSVDFGGGALQSDGFSDVVLAKLDATGDHRWSKRFGDSVGGFQYGTALAIDASSRIIVTGAFEGGINFGGENLTSSGNRDVFLVVLDALGNHVWSQRFGDPSFQEGNGVAVDKSGNVVLVGRFFDSIDFGGGSLASAGASDIFVAKFDSLGNHIWSKRFGDALDENCTGVVVSSTGRIFITGHFDGSIDFGGGALSNAGGMDIFVVELDADGKHVWSKRFGDSTSSPYPSTKIALDGADNVVVGGYFFADVDFGGGTLLSSNTQTADIVIVKFDATGKHIWSKRFGDANGQFGTGISVDSAGSVLVSGFGSGVVDFGGGPLNGFQSAVFLAKFSP
jgi:hypothetical protein